MSLKVTHDAKELACSLSKGVDGQMKAETDTQARQLLCLLFTKLFMQKMKAIVLNNISDFDNYTTSHTITIYINAVYCFIQHRICYCCYVTLYS